MNTELRKRLEEAAKEYAINDDSLIDSCDTTSVSDGFLAGAELGYKEAVKVAKEWLQTSFFQCLGDDNVYWDSAYIDITEALDSFETDMNNFGRKRNESKRIETWHEGMLQVH